MAEENRYAVATGDWTDTATWSTSSGGSGGASVPDTDQHAIIESGVNVTINANDEIKSLTVNSGGTLTGNSSYSLTLNDEGDSTYGTAGYALKVVGALGTNVNIILTTQATTIILVSTSGAGGSLHNLTINHASCDAVQFSHITLAGDLTITAGALSTGSNKNLTVAGITTIGPDSGAADQATLTCNASTMSLGTGLTSAYALEVTQGGTFVGGTGAHTIGSIKTRDNAASKLTMTTGVCTINGEDSSANYNVVIYDDSTFDNADGTITLTGPSSRIYFKAGSDPHHLIINNGSATYKLNQATTIEGNLTITAGTLTTLDGVTHNALTVGSGNLSASLGHVSVSGTLTCNNSVVQVGSIKIESGGTMTAPNNTMTVRSESATGYSLENAGTFHHASNRIDITGPTDSHASIKGFTSSHPLNNLYINNTGSNMITFMEGAIEIEGYLYLQDGGFNTQGQGPLDVVGAVTINNGCTFDSSDSTISHGSLTIEDGGEYNATSKTLTITGVSNGAGYCFQNKETDATGFIHNSGLVHFNPTASDATYVNQGGNSFYDVKVDGNSTGQIFYFLGAGGSMVIDGDLDVIQGFYQQYTVTNTLTVHGLTFVRANAEWNDASATGRTIPSGTQTHHGLVTIESGPQFDLGSGTNNFNGGIRNLGGTIN